MKLKSVLLDFSEKACPVLHAISVPTRFAILLAIGRGETCVCQLESILGLRQAYISQHLMALQKAEILQDRRDGRHVYYRLKDESTLLLLRDAAVLSGLDPEFIDTFTTPKLDSICQSTPNALTDTTEATHSG